MIWNLMLTFSVICATYWGTRVINLISAYKLLRKPCQFKEETDTKQIFSKDLLPEKIDVLVLGAGASGLAAASTLAKLGKKVVVLEQSKKSGGGMHTFKKEGFLFDTGFHYIGGIKDVSILLDLIGSKKIEFNVFKTFDRIMLENEVFDLQAPSSLFFENLLKKFPQQSMQIKEYRKLCKKVKIFMQFFFLNQLLVPQFLKVPFQKIIAYIFSSIYNKSVDEVFDNIGIYRNSKLYALLNANYGDMGQLPDKLPFVLHVGLIYHYIRDGSLYPKEGLHETVKSIVSAINANGGHVFTKARVDKILMKGSQVTGVEVQGGVVINCNKIISTIGRNNTVKCLPEEQVLIKPKVEQQPTCVSIFLGVDLEKNIFPTHNIWLHRMENYNYDLYESRKNGLKNIEKMNMFFSFPTSKQNPDSKKQSVQIIAEVDQEQFMEYRINAVQRKPGYVEFKQKFEEVCVQQLIKLFPECKDRIVYKSTGTPLTNEKYLGRFSMYGENVDVKKFFDLQQIFKFKQSIQGLYIAGQDVQWPSIVGAMMNGLLVGLTVTNYI